MSAARRALLLLAVEPRLKGVLIASASGSGKSMLARSFGSILLPGVRPHDEKRNRARLINIPLNVTEDRLIGGIDLERTLAARGRRHALGLLAQADGGLISVDDINLLDASLCERIAAALDMEIVRVEREGLSATHAARFVLVGTYDPQEGEVSPHLRERVGLIADCAGENRPDDLIEIMSRAISFDKDPRGFVEEYSIETAALKAAIADARSRLATVRITREDVRRMAQAALSMEVEGNRADLFATRAARANAALAGRDAVTDEDIVAAIQLVLLPRANALPNGQSDSEQKPEHTQDESNHAAQEHDDFDSKSESSTHSNVDRVIAALDSLPPEGALAQSIRKSHYVKSGKRAVAIDRARGRYCGSTAKRNQNARIALDATLRAAAPFQSSRRAAHTGEGRIRIAATDLRFKKFKGKSGMLFIFALDASGSMQLNRMAQAKGALTRLLEQAYLHRDKVALISFRRAEAETLLAPTRSVELAKQLVDALPTGGATPLAKAIEKALEIARLARLRGMSQAMLVLLTDGRSNVGLRKEGTGSRMSPPSVINEELAHLGAALQSAGVASVVIDTKPRFVSSGEGRGLADLLGGRYLYLPRADPKMISNAVKAIASQVRSVS
ncbi:MAG TPA: magnesium chelatase ATPase subunit D [Blastocatellia bacterium]|nr:magnesium chelatase ATPase subunit D [Blastocatellia bacterium]